jgi:AcrR family transcriptional regulator
LDAALSLMSEKGIKGASVDAVAERSGVSKVTIYKRFGSKEDLFLEAIRSMHEGEEEGTEGAPGGAGDVREALLGALKGSMRSGGSEKTRNIMPRLIGESVDDPELARAWRESIAAPRRRRIEALLERAVGEGRLRGDLDPAVGAELLVGPIFYRRLVKGEPPGDLPERALDALWAAFGAEGAQGPAGGTPDEGEEEGQ